MTEQQKAVKDLTWKAQVALIRASWKPLSRVRDLEGAIMAGGTPNSRRIRGCDGSNGRR